MTTGGFAHPEFLVEAAWVEAHRNDPNLVIVDTDVEAGYLRGHIPAAVMVPDNYEKDPGTGRLHILPPDKFAAILRFSNVVAPTSGLVSSGAKTTKAIVSFPSKRILA